MTSKSQFNYEAIFDYIKSYAKENSLELQISLVLCDFEKGIHNALISNFKVKVIGCYFHFIKALWGKANKLGLKNKERIKKIQK